MRKDTLAKLAVVSMLGLVVFSFILGVCATYLGMLP